MTDESIKSDAVTPKSSPKMVKKAKKATPSAKVEREASTISFPYMDLETAISVATAILGSGGVALSRDQLAGVMNTTAGSGTFLMKVSTARIFGLISNAQGKYELTNLGFSILDKDDGRRRKVLAEAFLSVPLYRRAYDEFKGKQLPPRPHGLQSALVKFGVAAKQGQNARLAFDKSARQAGFFSNGPDRLIEPIIGTGPAVERNRPQVDQDDDDVSSVRRGPTLPPDDSSARHPFIQGLLDTLPEPSTNWTVEGRAKWLQAAANIFDLIYKGSGEIKITSSPDPEATRGSQ